MQHCSGCTFAAFSSSAALVFASSHRVSSSNSQVCALGPRWRPSAIGAKRSFVPPNKTLRTFHASQGRLRRSLCVISGDDLELLSGSESDKTSVDIVVNKDVTSRNDVSNGSSPRFSLVPTDKLRVPNADLNSTRMLFKEQDVVTKLANKFRLFVSWPKFKKNSILFMELSGGVSEKPPTGFPPPSLAEISNSLPQITRNLVKAAADPRIKGVFIKLGLIGCGYGKLEELRRHIDYFRQSGKFIVAYADIVTEKEFLLGSLCDEFYIPPEAIISLRGFRSDATFLNGVLENIGIEPQVERIGKYKSAGDQLARKTMSDAQEEVLNSLLDQRVKRFCQLVAVAKGKTEEDVLALLDSAPNAAADLSSWVTGILYPSQLDNILKTKVWGANAIQVLPAAQQPQDLPEGVVATKTKPLRMVPAAKYSRVKPKTLGLNSNGRAKIIAVLRTSGAITRGGGSSSPLGGGSGITPEPLIQDLRKLKDDKRVAGIILRIDSPGGDALASDLMWNEIRSVSAVKPIVASMSDVAASGGYYMAMGCKEIVAEESTITGSIGVVTLKPSFAELYERVGISKQYVSRGKFAQLDVDNRPFTEEEKHYFARGARKAYESFRNKAASSRSMAPEQLEHYAQGRVWTGGQALERGLVDHIGGLSVAYDRVRELAKIKKDEQTRLLEFVRPVPGPLAFFAKRGAQAYLLAEPSEAALPSWLTDLLAMTLAGQTRAVPADISEASHLLSLAALSQPMALMDGYLESRIGSALNTVLLRSPELLSLLLSKIA